MYALSAVRQIQPASAQGFAGVCQAISHPSPGYGWFVPYRRIRRRVPEQADVYVRRAVIRLVVEDLSPGSTFVDILPFIINPGTDVTVIPRRLLERADAFPPGKALGPYQIGEAIVGLHFRAAIAIASRSAHFTPLSFGILRPMVNNWQSEYGVLGRDALQQVVMVFNADYVGLWPRSTDEQAHYELSHTAIQPASLTMSHEEARKVANFYIVMKLGDALCPAEMKLHDVEGAQVWCVAVVHRRTRRRFGVLHIAASGAKHVTWHPEPDSTEVSAAGESD
jgi:hypothetical protein